MDPMKSFEELRLRLQRTLKEAQHESTSFSSRFIQNEISLEDKFHKFPLTKKKAIRPVNEIKTSKKPKILSRMRVQTESQDYQSCGERTPKSLNFTDQATLNMNNEREKITEKFNMKTLMKKPKQCHEKCQEKCMIQIQRLKIALEAQKSINEKHQIEINNYQSEKVEYQQIVFQLKANKQTLIKETKNLYKKITQLNLKQVKVQKDLKISHGIISLHVKDSKNSKNPPFLTKDSQTHQKTSDSIEIDNKANLEDLQTILFEMKKKVFQYEKQLAQKQTLYNHQHYLLEKLKNEQNQLHLSQTSLLQELEYMLKKIKTIKKENQQIKTQNQSIKTQKYALNTEISQLKAQNQERIRQFSLLQDINTKIQQDLSQLFMHINEIQKQKTKLQNKLQYVTSVSKQPLKEMQIDIDNNFQLVSPLNLQEKLRKDECLNPINYFTLQKTDNMPRFLIDQCIQVSFESEMIRKDQSYQFFKRYEISELVKKDQLSLQNNIFSRSIQLDDTLFSNQLQISRQRISKFQKELTQSKKAQQQAYEQLEKVKMNLKNILKDLKVLSIEHESMKQLRQREKINFQIQMKEKQNIILDSLRFIEQLKRTQLSNA